MGHIQLHCVMVLDVHGSDDIHAQVAIIPLAAGISVALVGRFVPALVPLFTIAWFVGDFLSGGLYYIIMQALGFRPATVVMN